MEGDSEQFLLRRRTHSPSFAPSLTSTKPPRRRRRGPPTTSHDILLSLYISLPLSCAFLAFRLPAAACATVVSRTPLANPSLFSDRSNRASTAYPLFSLYCYFRTLQLWVYSLGRQPLGVIVAAKGYLRIRGRVLPLRCWRAKQ